MVDFLLQLEDVDADDLLSFLDPPPDLSTPPSSGASGQTPQGAGSSGGVSSVVSGGNPNGGPGSDASGRTPTHPGGGNGGTGAMGPNGPNSTGQTPTSNSMTNYIKAILDNLTFRF